jgi:hypothetical protein
MDGRTALSLDSDAFRLAAAREAIGNLALIVAEAEDIIWHMLDFRLTDHPRARATAYRKNGEQLSPDEKRALGLRSNAFLSRRAFAEITEAGLISPLEAHEKVLLRASFSLFRYRTIQNARQAVGLPDTYKYDVLNLDCPACEKLDGKITTGDEAYLFAPPRCRCETANFAFALHIDWLADLD